MSQHFAEFVFVTALYLLGLAYSVMSSVGKLKDKFPELEASKVWSTFFKEEWNTLTVSVLGLVTVDLALFIVYYKKLVLATWLSDWGIYAFALLGGYMWQRFIYSIMNTTEKRLNKEIKRINNEDNS